MRRGARTAEEAGSECVRAWEALEAANRVLTFLSREADDPAYPKALEVVASLARRYDEALQEFMGMQA